MPDLRHFRLHIDLFRCPYCGSNLRISDSNISCTVCAVQYKVDGGVPLLFAPTHSVDPSADVTEVVKAFYEQSPFPDYEEFETAGDLVRKAERGQFALILNDQLPFNAPVLEVGCGTGQLTNYLGVTSRVMFGADMCLNSLKLAEGFRAKNELTSVGFYQMNLFRPTFKDGSFQVVICNGVLHHTGDPLGGFRSIANLVKKGGFILVGLYNTYGRLITDIRRSIFRLTGNRLKFLDPRLRADDRGEKKRLSWFNDQYKNPHESKHTIGEVLEWFRATGFDFVYGIPNPKASERFAATDSFFEPHGEGSRLDHAMIQARFAVTGGGEGGLFVMIGRKR